jgi:hypothetical protein
MELESLYYKEEYFGEGTEETENIGVVLVTTYYLGDLRRNQGMQEESEETHQRILKGVEKALGLDRISSLDAI